MRQHREYIFGVFRLDPARRLLLKQGRPVGLTPRVFDTLVALVSEHGRVVSKEDLLKTVWGETFVEENNLSQSISALRKALGDAADENRYVATVPRKGYSFVAGVTEIEPVETAPVSLENRDAGEPSPSPSPEKPDYEPRPRRPLVAAMVAAVALACAALGAV